MGGEREGVLTVTAVTFQPPVPLSPRLAWFERAKLYAEGDKLYLEGSKLTAEGDKLHAEGRKLYAEGDLLFANAVIHKWGSTTVVDHRPNGDVEVMGELFRADQPI